MNFRSVLRLYLCSHFRTDIVVAVRKIIIIDDPLKGRVGC